jgi:hypothetical protein
MVMFIRETFHQLFINEMHRRWNGLEEVLQEFMMVVSFGSAQAELLDQNDRDLGPPLWKIGAECHDELLKSTDDINFQVIPLGVVDDGKDHRISMLGFQFGDIIR